MVRPYEVRLPGEDGGRRDPKVTRPAEHAPSPRPPLRDLGFLPGAVVRRDQKGILAAGAGPQARCSVRAASAMEPVSEG